MSIRLEHINKYIGRQHVLKDLTVAIGKGEVVGLLGPNGAGKSTLMKLIVGLWQADSGELEVCGVNMRTEPHQVATHIGYLPENNPLYEDMYVVEYLLFIAQLNGVERSRRKKVVSELIAQVGLTPEAHKHIRELSKGYRQRVGLAAALIGDPELLVLDEPTTGLDPNQLDDIRQLIRQLGQQRTVLLSTHIMQEVEAMCSRAIIIANGELRCDTTDLSDLEHTFRQATN